MIWEKLASPEFLGLLLALGPFTFAILISMLSPGRKWTMRTVREEHYEGGDIEGIFSLFAQRLEFEGFTLELDRDRHTIEASRTNPLRTGASIAAHAQKPLKASVQIEKGMTGVSVRIVMWMTDLVLFDTGEGPFIDETLERILHADLDREPPPLVPNPSFMVTTALWTAIACLAATTILLYPGYDVPQMQRVLVGLLIGNAVAFGTGTSGLLQIWQKPKEVTGMMNAIIAVLIVVLNGALAFTIFALRSSMI